MCRFAGLGALAFQHRTSQRALLPPITSPCESAGYGFVLADGSVLGSVLRVGARAIYGVNRRTEQTQKISVPSR